MRSPSAAYTFPESQSPSGVCPSSVSHNDCRTSSPTISDKTSKQQGLVLNYRLERLQRLRRASRCWQGIASSEIGPFVDRSSIHAMSTTSKQIVAGDQEDTDDGFIGIIEADLSHGAAADSTNNKQESLDNSVEKTTSQFGIRRKNFRNITKRMIASRETSKRISILQRMQGSRVTTVQGVLAVEGGIKLQSRHQAAVMKIQNVYRGRLERTKCAAGMGTARRDQNIVQRANAIRKASTLKLIHKEAAIKLQACFRGYMQKMKYKRTVSGIVLCQNVAKRVFLKNTGSQLERCRYLQRMDDQYRSTKNGTHFVINSSEWDSSGPIESTDHKNITESFGNAAFLALRLQAIYRGFRSRQQFVVVKSRLHELRHVEACIMIQSCWRSFLCCRDFAVTVMDITTVQSVVRRWFACRRVHKLKKVTLQQKHESEYEDPDETLGCSKCGLNTELEATITTVGEDLSFCIQDVSLEEEMNEIQLSFEEEILELQMSFEDEIARIQRRIHQVARMDFW